MNQFTESFEESFIHQEIELHCQAQGCAKKYRESFKEAQKHHKKGLKMINVIETAKKDQLTALSELKEIEFKKNDIRKELLILHKKYLEAYEKWHAAYLWYVALSSKEGEQC